MVIWVYYKKYGKAKNIYNFFASVYPFYIQKVRKKGRAKTEVDAIICWLTGHNQKTLQQQINNNDFETFFTQASQINENASKITGKICSCRVEEIEDKYNSNKYKKRIWL
jgi:hypothetical protein